MTARRYHRPIEKKHLITCIICRQWARQNVTAAESGFGNSLAILCTHCLTKFRLYLAGTKELE